METDRLLLCVQIRDADVDYLDKEARNLLLELKEVDGVISVTPEQAAEIPEGVMSGNSFDVGKLVIEIIESTGLSALLSFLASWLSRDNSRSIRFKVGQNEIEVKGLSQKEQQELIKWFKEQSSYHWNQ